MKTKIIRTNGSPNVFAYVDKSDSSTLFNTFLDQSPDIMAKEVLELRRIVPDLKNPVEHLILSFPHGETHDEEKLNILAQEYLKRQGVNLNDHPVKIELHRDKSKNNIDKLDIHILCSRIGHSGNVWKNQNSAKKGIKICRIMEKEFGLQISPPDRPIEERKRIQDPEEIGMSERLNEDSPKSIMANRIDQAIDLCRMDGTGLSGMIKQLKKYGISVQFNISSNDKIRGISFQLDNWSSVQSSCSTGSKIGKAYSYQNILKRIDVLPPVVSNKDSKRQKKSLPNKLYTQSDFYNNSSIIGPFGLTTGGISISPKPPIKSHKKIESTVRLTNDAISEERLRQEIEKAEYHADAVARKVAKQNLKDQEKSDRMAQVGDIASDFLLKKSEAAADYEIRKSKLKL